MKGHHQALLFAAVCCAAALPFFYGPSPARETASPDNSSVTRTEAEPTASVASKGVSSQELDKSEPSLTVPMQDETRQPTPFQSPIEVPGSNLTTVSKASTAATPYYSPVPALANDASLPNEVELSVPAGAQLPAVLVQSSEGENQATELSSAQQKLADHLAMEFARGVAQDGTLGKTGTAKDPDPEALKRWRSNASKSDERFRSLFGYDTFNRESIRKYQSNN